MPSCKWCGKVVVNGIIKAGGIFCNDFCHGKSLSEIDVSFMDDEVAREFEYDETLKSEIAGKRYVVAGNCDGETWEIKGYEKWNEAIEAIRWYFSNHGEGSWCFYGFYDTKEKCELGVKTNITLTIDGKDY